jgi:hypothetical protein
MQSNGAKAAAVAILSVAVIVVLFVVLSGGSDDESTTSTTATTAETTTTTGSDAGKPAKEPKEPAADIPVIQIKGGQPVGGVQDLEFDKGDEVKFEVTTDGDEGEIHVHGYDIPQEFENGKTVFDFPADIDGVFEVEIEETAVPIAELTVNP